MNSISFVSIKPPDNTNESKWIVQKLKITLNSTTITDPTTPEETINPMASMIPEFTISPSRKFLGRYLDEESARDKAFALINDATPLAPIDKKIVTVFQIKGVFKVITITSPETYKPEFPQFNGSYTERTDAITKAFNLASTHSYFCLIPPKLPI